MNSSSISWFSDFSHAGIWFKFKQVSQMSIWSNVKSVLSSYTAANERPFIWVLVDSPALSNVKSWQNNLQVLRQHWRKTCIKYLSSRWFQNYEYNLFFDTCCITFVQLRRYRFFFFLQALLPLFWENFKIKTKPLPLFLKQFPNKTGSKKNIQNRLLKNFARIMFMKTAVANKWFYDYIMLHLFICHIYNRWDKSWWMEDG